MTSSRLESLDAFRGLAIAGMILVNNPGSWSHVYGPLQHAPWHGWTPTDLIFPFFLFIVGVAIPLSVTKRRRRGATRGELMRHVVRRSGIIFALGLFMAAFPRFDLAGLRVMGVLQRISLVYLAAAAAYLYLGRRGRWGLAVALLLGYWVLMVGVPVPGYGAGDLSAEGNLASYVDRAILGDRMWREAYDPEGLLSTVPAIVTALLGIATGQWLLSDSSGWRKAWFMALAGVLGVVAGLAWDRAFPINKSLWTSSYVLLSAGWALVTLSLFYWLIEVRGYRRWCKPLVVYGVNAIAVFVASGLVAKLLGIFQVGDGTGDAVATKTWLYRNLFESWAGPLNGSLAFAISYVLVWLGLMWVLYARRIYIKI